jgi:hypothetical protein
VISAEGLDDDELSNETRTGTGRPRPGPSRALSGGEDGAKKQRGLRSLTLANLTGVPGITTSVHMPARLAST